MNDGGDNVSRGCWRQNSLFAGFLYIVLSVGIFGRQVLWSPANSYVGGGYDPSQMMWFLVWWPYAIIHSLNPFITKVVWPPAGVNLAWMTPIPALSILTFPVTYSLGPVVSYNLLSLLGPALSAGAAFQLCNHVIRRFWPSFAGGYLYGFSSYEVGQVLGGHLGHSLVMLPPLVVLLFLSLVEGNVSRPRFIVYFTGCLFVQFLISTALFATMTVFGAGALMLGWCFSDPVIRSHLRRSVSCLIIAYVLTAVALSPYLFYVLAFGMPHNPIWPLDYYSADLVGFLVPNRLCRFNFSLFGLDTHFLFDPWETGAYLGVPLVLLCGWYCLENRRLPSGRLLTVSLVVILLAALGPRLHVAGRETVLLPWAAVAHLPFIKHELPGRFMLFAFLIIAMMASIWLSRGNPWGPARLALVSISVLFLWPSVQTSSVDLPLFFTTGAYRRFLRRSENVLVVPFGWNGNSMLWQAQSLMYFRMAGGYLGATPHEFERWPIVDALYWSILTPDVDVQLKDFLSYYGIDALILEDSDKGPWAHVFSHIDSAPAAVGGVRIYKVRREEAAGSDHTDAVQDEASADVARFTEMIDAADEYLRRGLDPAGLSCGHAQRLGLLPDRGESLDTTTNAGWCHRMWLGPLEGDPVGIGLIDYYQGLEAVIARYGKFARNVFYPYPRKFGEKPPLDSERPDTLIMTFSREQLLLAAAAARSYRAIHDTLAHGADAYERNTPPASGKSSQIQQLPASVPEDGVRPVITAVDGTPVLDDLRGNSTTGAGLPVLPARRGAWEPWWRQAESDNLVVIEGRGFDTEHGIAVDVFCDCPDGHVGPFRFEPGYHLFDQTRIYFKVPLCGAQAPLAGVGSIVVANKGSSGHYLSKSNRAPVLFRGGD